VKHLEFDALIGGTGDTGSEQTVVFLHGGNVAGWMWGEQVPAFDAFHVLVADLPGFGASNDEEWTDMSAAADAVAALIRERANGGTAHVIGLSLGAGVGLHLALRHPEVVTSLLISSASVTPPSRAAVAMGRVMLAAWNRRWFWRALAKGYGLPADSVDLFVETGLGIKRETALAIFAETKRGFSAEQLAAVGVPTLAVAGDRDAPAIATESLGAIRERVPGAIVATAPGMHHQWNIENIALFNAMATTWVREGRVASGMLRHREQTLRE
jgi:pimeloyl-ACP methyl ester carboxylesterase